MLSLPRIPNLLPHGPRPDEMHNTQRNSLWSSGHPGRLTERSPQQGSPRETDLTPTRSTREAFVTDQRAPITHNDYRQRPISLSSPYPTEIPHFLHQERIRSTLNQSPAFGTRSQSQESPGYPSETPWNQQVRRPELDGFAPEPTGGPIVRYPRARPLHNRDEFDGPAQYLPLPLPQQQQCRTRTMLSLPVNLTLEEQDAIARHTDDILSRCAYHFVATYQFPIPIERDKPPVEQASDRDWTEWAYLLKRLATKRRIPARVLYDGQIKQLVTTLENSFVVRQTTSSRPEASTVRPDRDDRYMLQLVSSGLQVAKILKDSEAMEQLNQLYMQTEALIFERRRMSSNQNDVGVGHVGRGAPGRAGRAIGSANVGGGVIGVGVTGTTGPNVH